MSCPQASRGSCPAQPLPTHSMNYYVVQDLHTSHHSDFKTRKSLQKILSSQTLRKFQDTSITWIGWDLSWLGEGWHWPHFFSAARSFSWKHLALVRQHCRGHPCFCKKGKLLARGRKRKKIETLGREQSLKSRALCSRKMWTLAMAA